MIATIKGIVKLLQEIAEKKYFGKLVISFSDGIFIDVELQIKKTKECNVN